MKNFCYSFLYHLPLQAMGILKNFPGKIIKISDNQ